MDKKLKKNRNMILIALVFYAAALCFEKIIAPGRLPEGVTGSHWIMMIPYLAPYVIVGWPVLRGAFYGIKNRQMFDEKFLMAIATIGAFITGENAEACAVMLFYQVGEWFQDYAVGKSRRSITELMEIAPESANIEREDGTVEEVDPDDVEVGDILVVRPGEKVPVDGVITEGTSMVNTAALTGEPVPRTLTAGDPIISGCVNGEGLLKMRAEKEYDDSTVAKILEMVEDASSRKSKTERFITRFARYYTPAVVFAALALAVIPSILVGNPATWIYRACTFLVISCPCALVISVPLAFFGGIGASSKAGVLVKGSNFLELMANLDTVVTDKTGTLTEGNFVVNRVIPAPGFSEDQVLEAASLAEGMSTHPIAVSIRSAFGGTVHTNEIQDLENVTGRGVITRTAGSEILAGNAALMRDHGIEPAETGDEAMTSVMVARDGAYLGEILIADRVKTTAAQAVREMKEAGVRRVVMLTGDRKKTADAVAGKLGVDQVWSELLPGDKVAKVEELLADLGASADDIDEDGVDRSKRKRLAFVGDGINDAPVLSRADVGIAMGSMGSDAAIEVADIVIMDDDLRRIPLVIRIARRTISISRQNIVFAIAVKLLILALGAVGIANMWAAVFADVGVAVICIINSMRMLRRVSLTPAEGQAVPAGKAEAAAA